MVKYIDPLRVFIKEDNPSIRQCNIINSLVSVGTASALCNGTERDRTGTQKRRCGISSSDAADDKFYQYEFKN